MAEKIGVESLDGEVVERIVEAQERQAEALELVAGMMMVRFHYDEDTVDFSAEALRDEAEHFASGGGVL